MTKQLVFLQYIEQYSHVYSPESQDTSEKLLASMQNLKTYSKGHGTWVFISAQDHKA